MNKIKHLPLKHLVVQRAPGKTPSNGILYAENHVFPCLLGKNGITTRKVEGDMKTPAGQFRLLGGYYRKNRIGFIQSGLELAAIKPDMGWCDAPDSANYNRAVKLPFCGSHERLMREDSLYDIVIVMDHNYHRRIKGRGSAVFFHLTAEKNHTAGCVGISRDAMLKLLPRLSTQTIMTIKP